MKHTDTVSRYNGSMTQLAEEIGNLKYDALASFLSLLSKKIESDGEKDFSRGRIKLAASLKDCSLKDCSLKLKESSLPIERAWEICKPYMETK